MPPDSQSSSEQKGAGASSQVNSESQILTFSGITKNKKRSLRKQVEADLPVAAAPKELPQEMRCSENLMIPYVVSPKEEPECSPPAVPSQEP